MDRMKNERFLFFTGVLLTEWTDWELIRISNEIFNTYLFKVRSV